MGDKPSKSQSDDETLPPYLSRTDFQFNAAAARLSFSAASSDTSYQLRPRLSYEDLGAVACNDNAASVNGSASPLTFDLSGTDLQFKQASSGPTAMASPKRQGNSRLASPDSGNELHRDRSLAAYAAQSPGSDIHDNFRVNSGNCHLVAADVSASGTSEGSSAIEPPSPSTSSTKTVISVIHVQDAKGVYTSQQGRGQPGSILSAKLSVLNPSSADAGSSESVHSKLTLGDILHDIENRSKILLQQSVSSSGSVSHLQFLAQQSRYGTDANVKRRILTKLVDCGLVDIIHNFLQSLNLDECLRQQHAVNQYPASAPVFKANTNGSAVKDKGDTASVADDDESASGSSDSMCNLRSVITLLWNTSDKLATFCEQCVQRGILTQLLDLLQDRRLSPTELQDKNRFFIVRGCLGAVANIVRMCDDDLTRETCRTAGCVRVVQQYLRCALLAIRTKALVILSYVANESENDLIHTSDKNISFAVKMLQSAVESDNHYSQKYGFWAVEIMTGLNRLASYESNKERLLSAGLLSVCILLLEPSCSDEEILVAVQTFWIMSFNSQVRSSIVASSQYMNAIEQLASHATRDEIKRAALSALWVLKYRDAYRPPAVKLKGSDKDGAQILMLSHQTSRQIVLKIRNRLRSIGYLVHIDPDLRGSGMESAIENVNRAGVVVVFMSNRLKNSPACRTELEYAVSIKKPMIPVRLHRTFVADGWLSVALTDLPVVEFVDDDSFDATISLLIRHISTVPGIPILTTRKAESPVSTSSDAAQTRASMALPSPDSVMAASSISANSTNTTMPLDNNVAQWSTLDVEKWLRHHGLDFAAVRLKGITGELLLEIRRMQQSAPESYYTSLRTDLQLDFVSVLKFTRALSTL